MHLPAVLSAFNRLPIWGSLTNAFILSLIVTALTAAASITGLFFVMSFTPRPG